MDGAIGAMILFTALKAQESNLPQNKFNPPEDKLKSVKDKLTEMNLANLFKAKGVKKGFAKEEIIEFGLNCGKIKLDANITNYILEFLERDDIRKMPQSDEDRPSTTPDTSKRNTTSLANRFNPKGRCTIG